MLTSDLVFVRLTGSGTALKFKSSTPERQYSRKAYLFQQRFSNLNLPSDSDNTIRI